MNTPGVAAVVFDRTKENFLLVKRRDVPVWVLPGGGIDPDEDPAVAAVREVREESGLEVRIVRQVAKYTPTGRLSAVTHLFECELVDGVPTASDETSDAAFFSVDEWPKPVLEVHRSWLTDTRANHPGVIEKPVQGLGWLAIVKMILQHPILCARFLLTRVGLRWNSA